MLKFISVALILNVLAILLGVMRGARGRVVMWGLQLALVWLWLAIGSLAVIAIRYWV